MIASPRENVHRYRQQHKSSEGNSEEQHHRTASLEKPDKFTRWTSPKFSSKGVQSDLPLREDLIVLHGFRSAKSPHKKRLFVSAPKRKPLSLSVKEHLSSPPQSASSEPHRNGTLQSHPMRANPLNLLRGECLLEPLKREDPICSFVEQSSKSPHIRYHR
jgi:hypothetical protein